MIDRDEQLGLIPLEDEEAGRLLAAVPAERRKGCWWIVGRDGAPVAGKHGGGIALLTAMRLTRPVGRMLEALRLSPLIDLLDAVVARYRGRLGKFVPDGPAPRRFP